MVKGFRYRIYPNKEQEQQLNQMLGNARFVYNWALDRRIKEYQAEKKSVSAFTLMTELTQLKKQPEYDWLKLSVAQSLQQSIVNMDKAFTRFFKQKKGFPKFKSKPVEIEAIQYTGKNDFEIGKWSNDLVYPSPVLEPTENNPSGSYLQIKTLEGVMTAIVGDWIIKGVKGEFYPCKNDIFLMTYDVVIPKDVQDAQKFLQECGRDMGFMGSPEYDRQQKIVDAYFEPIKQKEKEDLERLEYLKLKSKYEGSYGFR